MSALPREHPVQVLVGALHVAQDMANKARELGIVVICEQAELLADDLRGILVEIGDDAGRGELAVENLLSDGDASAADRKQLLMIFREIRTEALEAKAI